MTVSVDDFVAKVNEINAEDPDYLLGHDGSDGKCDCVGLLIGALRRSGIKYTGIHGSNFFARKMITDLVPIKITTPAMLEKGMAVFKSTDSTENLPSRYMPGGRYYNGDTKDYYHIGVVTNVKPLQITHCTTGKNGDDVPIDTSLGKWAWGGHIKGVRYNEQEETKMDKYIVTANGSVNMRKQPKTGADLMERVPHGTVVDGEPENSEWLRIVYKGRTGYCMAEFLTEWEAADEVEDTTDSDVVTPDDLPERITALEKRVAKLEKKLKEGGIG